MKTIILAGNGSTDNGWTPVEVAIANNYKNFDIYKIDPNIFFTNLIFQLRFLARFNFIEKLNDRIVNYYNLKESISKEIISFQKKVRLNYLNSLRKF